MQYYINTNIALPRVSVVILVLYVSVVFCTRIYVIYNYFQYYSCLVFPIVVVEIDVNIGNLPTERHEDIKLVEQKKLTVSGCVVVNVHLH